MLIYVHEKLTPREHGERFIMSFFSTVVSIDEFMHGKTAMHKQTNSAGGAARILS